MIMNAAHESEAIIAVVICSVEHSDYLLLFLPIIKANAIMVEMTRIILLIIVYTNCCLMVKSIIIIITI